MGSVAAVAAGVAEADLEVSREVAEAREVFSACRGIHRETRDLIGELLRKADHLAASGSTLPHRYDFIRESELPKQPLIGRSPIENAIGFIKGVACAGLVLGAVMAGLEPTAFVRPLLLAGAAMLTLVAGNGFGHYARRLIARRRDNQLAARHEASRQQWARYAEAVELWEQQRAKLGQSTTVPGLSMRDLEAVNELLTRTTDDTQRQVVEALLVDFAERALNARNLELTDTAAMKLYQWSRASRELGPVVQLACSSERVREGELHVIEHLEMNLGSLDARVRWYLASDLQNELTHGKSFRLSAAAKNKLVDVLERAKEPS